MFTFFALILSWVSRRPYWLLWVLGPHFNLWTCSQAPGINCRDMTEITLIPTVILPCLSFLEFGSAAPSLTTESVGANAGGGCWCHTFATIKKTIPIKWTVTSSTSRIVWICLIIALNAPTANVHPQSESVSGRWRRRSVSFGQSQRVVSALWTSLKISLLPNIM